MGKMNYEWNGWFSFPSCFGDSVARHLTTAGFYHPLFGSTIECFLWWSSDGSRISPRGGREPSKGGGGVWTHNYAEFSQKLHEIERIWTPRGGGGLRPSRPPLDPPLWRLWKDILMEGQDAETVHRREKPNCVFVIGLSNNVLIDENKGNMNEFQSLFPAVNSVKLIIIEAWIGLSLKFLSLTCVLLALW